MPETLDLPKIDPAALDAAPATVFPTSPTWPMTTPIVGGGVAAPDLTKIDLTDVALAMYGKWPDEVKAVKANLSTVVLDLSTAAKITEARSLRTRLILNPLAAARKVSQGIKSKMAATSKAVGAELERIEAAYKEADALILPKIEKREEELKAAAEAKAKVEQERKDRHQANIDRIRAFAVKADTEPGMTAERIATGIKLLEDTPTPTTATWDEFAVPAANAICETLERMRITHARVLRAEQAEAEAAELRKKLAAQAPAATMDAPPAGPAGDGSQKPDDAAAIPGARAGSEYTEGRASQQVLKAEPATADATDRDAPAMSSPSVGSMGSGQAADAAPAGGTINAATIERGAAALDAGAAAVVEPVYVDPADGSVHRFAPGPITMVEPATEAGRMIVSAKSAADFVPTSSTDPRDELLREALALTKYAAAPFAGKFPTHPKTTPEWWAGLREQIEALQPKLIEHLEGRAC